MKILLAALLVTAQPQSEPTITRDAEGIYRAPNGQIVEHHRFFRPEYARTERSVRMVYYPSLEALRAAHPEAGPIHGLTENEGDVCVIHLVDPRVDYQATLLGHEFGHCLFGGWHLPF